VKVKNTKTFIEHARKVHGDRYDYEKVVYTGAKEKVCITCKIHGDFWQQPQNHKLGKGCPSCVGLRRYDAELIIERARKMYGDKFDCSGVKVGNRSSVIEIRCPSHGVFRIMATNFLKGEAECSECDRESRCREFIERAKIVHGGIYDYSNVKYVRSGLKVEIICKKHGIFRQIARSHLNGSGCFECFRANMSLTKEDFVRKAMVVHGSKYDYGRSEYVNCNQKIAIVCPKHGVFLQLPFHHLYGYGCQRCSAPRGETIIARVLDLLGEGYETQKKFAGCRDKGVLSFDFYLPSRRVLIEADGMQHFVPFSFSSERDEMVMSGNFDAIKRRDRIKDEFAKKHGYDLIRMPYWLLKTIDQAREEILMRLGPKDIAKLL
jgi:very-short-patch-repair endonuclease